MAHPSVVEIRSLTGCRGLAALVVFAGHFREHIARVVDLGPLAGFLASVGYWVDFFFVLSGFILAHVYREAYARQGFRATTRDFLVARFVRLWPLHVLVLLALLAFGTARLALSAFAGVATSSAPFYGWTADGFVANLFLVQVIREDWTWNPPAWSISTEIAAYALFPLLFLRGHGPRLVAVLGIASIAGVHALDAASQLASFPGMVGRCVCEFLVGVAVQGSAWRLQGLSRRGAGLLQALAFAGAVSAIALHAPHAAIVSCFAVLVASLAADRGIVADILARNPMHWLGRISYSLYLTHWAIILVASSFIEFVERRLPGARAAIDVAAIVAIPAAVLAISAASHRLVETRLRLALLRRIAGAR